MCPLVADKSRSRPVLRNICEANCFLERVVLVSKRVDKQEANNGGI